MIEPSQVWFEIPIVSVGGWLGTILFVLWLMMTGRLIPRTTHRTIVDDKNQQIVDWRESARASEATSNLAIRNQDKLLEAVETSNALIRSLPGVSERNAS